eukprot:gene148-1203_t
MGKYYSYLWSEVFAVDMFVTKFKAKDDIFNPERGCEFREKVLAPGGTMDGMDIVKNYLGRDSNQDAFLEMLGLDRVTFNTKQAAMMSS